MFFSASLRKRNNFTLSLVVVRVSVEPPRFLLNGADLMLPGVVSVSLPERGQSKGSPPRVAVLVSGNPSALVLLFFLLFL